jgi:hypothetical protein
MMGVMDLITIPLLLLAVARLTRLVTADKLTEKPMFWMIGKVNRWPAIGYLFTCAWCTSVYLGAAGAAAWWAWGGDRWFTAVCAALAASHVAGFLAGKE